MNNVNRSTLVDIDPTLVEGGTGVCTLVGVGTALVTGNGLAGGAVTLACEAYVGLLNSNSGPALQNLSDLAAA